MDENVGGYVAKPLLGKLGGGGGNGRRGEHGHSGRTCCAEVKTWSKPPSLNKCAGKDSGHPLATATTRGSHFPSLPQKLGHLHRFLFPKTRIRSTIYKELRCKEALREIASLQP